VEEEKSGTSVHRERLATSGNRHGRRVFRLWTLGLVNPRTPWTPFRSYYERLIAPPAWKRPNVALGHLASKLICVLYACMSHQKLYDEARLAKDWRAGPVLSFTVVPILSSRTWGL
jgi:hypothetical protein